MRSEKPITICDTDESWPWEWTEFIKTPTGMIPVSLYEVYGEKVRFWQTTAWSKTYTKEAVRRLKAATSFWQVKHYI